MHVKQLGCAHMVTKHYRMNASDKVIVKCDSKHMTKLMALTTSGQVPSTNQYLKATAKKLNESKQQAWYQHASTTCPETS